MHLNTKGDWICSACANEIGFNVDIKGYEYAPDDSAVAIDDNSSDGVNPVDLTDTPEKLDLDDSDAPIDDAVEHRENSDEEESPVGRRRNHKKQTKQIIDLDDSDDE